MPAQKTIVVLANSWKRSGRCVAGREHANGAFGPWVRPVSDRSCEEVNEEERQFADGHEPEPLDVVRMVLVAPKPHSYQQENHLLDATCYWEKRGRLDWAELQGAVDAPTGPLWVNGHSTYNGVNDQVPEALAVAQTRSLYLVRPENLVLVVQQEGGVFGPAKLKVRARFTLNGATYLLSVTDPVVGMEFRTKGMGETPVGDALLCVSLGELFNGSAYKLVASVTTPQRARRP